MALHKDAIAGVGRILFLVYPPFRRLPLSLAGHVEFTLDPHGCRRRIAVCNHLVSHRSALGSHQRVSVIYSYTAVGERSVFLMFEPHPQDRYRLRFHRARSVVLTDGELVEIRAAQRTFEGAYIRTALGQFSFALVILKIFTSEFYSIGALFALYGTGILLTGLLRRQYGNKQFFSEIGEDGISTKRFRTSGNVVVVLTALSVAAYASLLGLTLKMGH